MFTEEHYAEFHPIPPYSFELTVHKPAGWSWSTPSEVFENGVLWTVARLNSRMYGLKLQGNGTPRSPTVECAIFSKKPMNELELEAVTRTVRRALGIDEDLTEFYTLAKKDNILRPIVEDLCGMRTLDWPDLFPALILAVTLQMAPMKRSNQMMDLLIENFGDVINFDGKAIAHWPSPKRIAEATVKDLEVKAKLGYRAKNLNAIAKTLCEGFPTADDLSKMEPNEAKKKLMTLRGIGEYSADIVNPGPGFPLDVWSAKIFGVLFTGKEPDAPREKIPELKKMAEARWGEWRGDAFVYVLNDLPRISKRIGVDLTSY